MFHNVTFKSKNSSLYFSRLVISIVILKIVYAKVIARFKGKLAQKKSVWK